MQLLKLTQARNDSDIAEETEEEALLERYTIDYACDDYCEVEVVGTREVNTICMCGGRLYINDGVVALCDIDGGLYVTAEQEEEYFL